MRVFFHQDFKNTLHVYSLQPAGCTSVLICMYAVEVQRTRSFTLCLCHTWRYVTEMNDRSATWAQVRRHAGACVKYAIEICTVSACTAVYICKNHCTKTDLQITLGFRSAVALSKHSYLPRICEILSLVC